MARRGENIRKRKDGRWEGRYIKGYDETGKAKYHSIYALSYNDCKSKLLMEKATVSPKNIQGGSYSENTKMAGVLDDWLESIRVSAKHSTYVKYRNTVNNHILPDFGGVRLKLLSASLINNFLLRKRDSGRLDGKGGLSASTVHTLYIIIASALAFASDNGYINGSAIKLKPPRWDDPEFFTLCETEQTRLEENLLTDMDNAKLGIFLCLYAGLRLGEICSLKWEDIDKTSRVIHVRNTVQRIQTFDKNSEQKTKLMVSAPKSKSSVRDIPIPSCLIEIINKFFPHSRSGYVVGDSLKPLDPRTYQYRFKGYLKKAGVKDTHFHALRHTFATNCIAAGVDAKSLCEILGHASVNITLNKYVHSSSVMKHNQMEKLSANRGQNPGNESRLSA